MDAHDICEMGLMITSCVELAALSGVLGGVTGYVIPLGVFTKRLATEQEVGSSRGCKNTVNAQSG